MGKDKHEHAFSRFAAELRRVRDHHQAAHPERRLSQARIAQQMAVYEIPGATEAAVSHWMSGRRVPMPVQLSLLVNMLGCSAGDIRRLVDAAAEQHVIYHGFATALADRSDAEYLIAWREWVLSMQTAPEPATASG